MKEGDRLFFAPRVRFEDLDFANLSATISAFEDRVRGFYLEPGLRLADAGAAFGAGVVASVAIDAIARYTTGREEVGERICEWLEANISHFRVPDPLGRRRPPQGSVKTLARLFYEDFRNGLVHEGRIKNLGQFALDGRDLVEFDGDAMIVNPRLLLEQIHWAFAHYCGLVLQSKTDAQSLIQRLRDDFEVEIIAEQKRTGVARQVQ